MRATLVCAFLIAPVAGMPALSQQSELEGAEEVYEQAALDFLGYCAPCHGQNGRGDGPVAKELITKPADLTLITQRAGGIFPQDEVAQRIDGRNLPQAHGSREMPVWGNWFKMEARAGQMLGEEGVDPEAEAKARVRALVDYLQTIQR